VRIGFYAAVPDRRLLEVVEFYWQDIVSLQQLGHEVVAATKPAELRAAEVYWVWWQTSGAPAVLTARLRRRPCVLVTALSDSDKTASGMPNRSAAARVAGRLALRAADIVLATSQHTLEGLRRYRTRAVRLAHLGVDTTLYHGDSYRRAAAPYVLTISQLTPDNVSRKRILDVVRTAALVPEMHFVIIGRFGGGERRVREAIADLGLQDRVTLTGELSAEAKRELLSGCSVYLQPTEYEAFGLAIAEAMASGAIVITNRVGSVPEVVGDAGYLMPSDAQPSDFAGAIRAALDGPDVDILRRRARQRIEQCFSLERRVEHIARALTTVISRRG
jgi:glycosyltransferase involved in cell wall biosynthesis